MIASYRNYGHYFVKLDPLKGLSYKIGFGIVDEKKLTDLGPNKGRGWFLIFRRHL
jgi:hypothetical protein